MKNEICTLATYQRARACDFRQNREDERENNGGTRDKKRGAARQSGSDGWKMHSAFSRIAAARGNVALFIPRRSMRAAATAESARCGNDERIGKRER